MPRTPIIMFLGILDNEYENVINFLFLMIKYYVYMCKSKKKIPQIIEWKTHIFHYRNVEMYGLHIYSNHKQITINQKWNFIGRL